MDYNLQTLLDYWKQIYLSDNPVQTLLNLEKSEKLQNIITNQFDLRYYPEPFYGYFGEDMIKVIRAVNFSFLSITKLFNLLYLSIKIDLPPKYSLF